jgi:hypothetical protein
MRKRLFVPLASSPQKLAPSISSPLSCVPSGFLPEKMLASRSTSDSVTDADAAWLIMAPASATF